ncbi:alpha/beta hydrolase [Gordonibacter sp. 28C]|uniref:alpha/beta fold hydrolase n=1 Tax=Gordonibacter sp. 28C TaxID=2078569 RepID=UPI000DF7CADB|nr:alpha/beta hydrolase [Gordonibacter sp. 28C]RDB63272.1 alpha/beta hydrolase [Gordonibacter sp. 28C]
MASTVSTTPIGFLSHDGTSQIRGLVWAPERQAGSRGPAPRGIVQIVHGMAEHLGRYDDFARFLVGRGFVVCASDHVGHGKSVPDPAKLGCLPAEGGKDVLVEDVNELRRTVAARYARQVPYVLFGHSMGSFVVRAYLARYAEGLAAAVVCGTGQQPLALSKAGNFLARRIAASKGEDYKSSFLDGLGAGAFAKQIENARTPFDWISVDPAVVDAYIADPLCGVMFSAGGYATLTDLTGEVVTRSCAAKVPRDLPVLFVAGAEDPVGACGKGVHAAAELLRGAGVERVDEIVYEGMRHEILNEPGRAQVYTDVAQWIEEHACEKPTS